MKNCAHEGRLKNENNPRDFFFFPFGLGRLCLAVWRASLETKSMSPPSLSENSDLKKRSDFWALMRLEWALVEKTAITSSKTPILVNVFRFTMLVLENTRLRGVTHVIYWAICDSVGESVIFVSVITRLWMAKCASNKAILLLPNIQKSIWNYNLSSCLNWVKVAI